MCIIFVSVPFVQKPALYADGVCLLAELNAGEWKKCTTECSQGLPEPSSLRGSTLGTRAAQGAKIIFIFQCHRNIEKLENSTLYV